MVFDVRKCRVCGCTDDRACEGGCYWVEEDLCSQCAADVDEVDVFLDPRRRIKALIAECEQTIIDGEYWNHRRDQPPIDIGSFRVHKAELAACLAALDAGDMPALRAHLDRIIASGESS